MCNCKKPNQPMQSTIDGAQKMATSLQNRAQIRMDESAKKLPSSLIPTDRCPFCGVHKWYYCGTERGCIITGKKPV